MKIVKLITSVLLVNITLNLLNVFILSKMPTKLNAKRFGIA